MVFKSYLVEKNISALDGYYAVLFYGENIGLKDDFKKLLKDKNKKSDIISFHENDIIKNKNLIDEQLMNNSLFNDKKIIIINDVSEKLKNEIIKITQEIQENIKIAYLLYKIIKSIGQKVFKSQLSYKQFKHQ